MRSAKVRNSAASVSSSLLKPHTVLLSACLICTFWLGHDQYKAFSKFFGEATLDGQPTINGNPTIGNPLNNQNIIQLPGRANSIIYFCGRGLTCGVKSATWDRACEDIALSSVPGL